METKQFKVHYIIKGSVEVSAFSSIEATGKAHQLFRDGNITQVNHTDFEIVDHYKLLNPCAGISDLPMNGRTLYNNKEAEGHDRT